MQCNPHFANMAKLEELTSKIDKNRVFYSELRAITSKIRVLPYGYKVMFTKGVKNFYLCLLPSTTCDDIHMADHVIC